MKKLYQLTSGCTFVALFLGCSTSHNLRKFDEKNIDQDFSAEIAKKFEIKEVVELKPTDPKLVKEMVLPVATKKGKKIKTMTTQKGLPVEPPKRRIDPMPFIIGEKLLYDIRYVGVTAGTFATELMPLKEVNGRSVYQVHAHAKTVPLFNLVYRVDDKIDSYFDYEGLYSHRFTMDLDESKQSRKLIELYDYDKNKSYYWNRVDHVEKGFNEEKKEFTIKPWSQDVLSALYFLRVADLPKEVGTEYRFQVILDGKPWESVVKFSKKGKQYANSRDFAANVYTMENYENGELKNKDNTIWISDDEHRYILRIEARVRVGSFAVALDKIQ